MSTTQDTPASGGDAAKKSDVSTSVGKALVDIPIGQMVLNLGKAIADAQMALDLNSIKVAQMMSGEYIPPGETTPQKTMVKFGGQDLSMLELGFTPTFYQFVETTIEVKLSINMTSTEERSGTSVKVDAKAGLDVSIFQAKADTNLNVTTVSASFASKFQYSAEGSSLIRTRLVPVPAPALLEERVRRLIDERTQRKVK